MLKIGPVENPANAKAVRRSALLKRFCTVEKSVNDWGMKITARCHPALKDLLPEPVPARSCLPDWLGKMPSDVQAESMGGKPVRTLKHCPPLIDALRTGVMLLCPTDIHVSGQDISWDWDFPHDPTLTLSRAPLGVHVPEQATGSAHQNDGDLFIKFVNYWTLEVPEGWSIAFHHPAGFPDLPFTTLSGIVDCDRFGLGYVHFPAALKPGFEGVIAKGTPIVQCFPMQRDVELEVATMTDEEVARNMEISDRIGADPGVYRKDFRR